MINVALLRTAVRSRAEALVVATTGTVTLSATSTGYARASGSFVTDGFAIGMELTPAGFPQTAPGVITAVTALTVTIDGGRAAATSAGSRTLTVGLPLVRAFENTALAPGFPAVSRPWIDENVVPSAGGMRTIPASGGLLAESGLLRWNWYGILGAGTDALDRGPLALARLFAPGTRLTLSDGSTVRLLGTPSPQLSQIRRVDAWAVRTITVYWRALTRNAVAA